MNDKPKYVAFMDKKTENSFEALKEGKFEDKKLYELIAKTITELKNNPIQYTNIPKVVWPKYYSKKIKIDNLWKCDLPNGWRIIYTIKTDEIMILTIILKWFNHNEYERRFNY